MVQVYRLEQPNTEYLTTKKKWDSKLNIWTKKNCISESVLNRDKRLSLCILLSVLFCFAHPVKTQADIFGVSAFCTMFGATEVYANSSFLLLSFCPPPCQAVGADAVTTARSREALVDAVKRSGGINTSEGRTEGTPSGYRRGGGRVSRRIERQTGRCGTGEERSREEETGVEAEAGVLVPTGGVFQASLCCQPAPGLLSRHQAGAQTGLS